MQKCYNTFYKEKLDKVNKNRFDTAFIKNKNYFIHESELKRIKEFEDERFSREFKKELVCPECRQAYLELEFGDKIRCLRTKPGETHEDSCQHSPNVREATTSHISDFKKTASPQKRKNNLWFLLSSLNAPENEYFKKSIVPIDETPFIIRSKTGNTTTYTYIPQQRIDKKNKFSCKIEKYYYGIVWLEIDNSKDYNVHLKFYSLSNNKKGSLICSIFISKNDESLTVLVDKIINKPAKSKYYVAFFGQMEIKKNKFYNLYINNEHDLVLVSI